MVGADQSESGGAGSATGTLPPTNGARCGAAPAAPTSVQGGSRVGS